MSQQYNSTTESRKNKHLQERERYRIEYLLKEGLKPVEIAKRLNRHVRTIEREIAKGKVKLINSDLTFRNEYCADTGQRKYHEAAVFKGPQLKIGKDHKLAAYIEQKIGKERYSPDAVIGQIREKKLEFSTHICTKTLYSYIDKGIFATITNDDLTVKRHNRKRGYKSLKIAHKNLKGTSIEERPKDIEKREDYGHWEMDCVVGKQGGSGSVLLVLSERMTREEIIIKMPNKKQESVIKALDSIEIKAGNRFKEKFITITVDNGTEFLDYKGIEKSFWMPTEKRVKVYYAHPYSSWERGTNENINKLIRRFIPKGSDIGDYTDKDIERIEHWINNYPRRIFGYKSANDMAA